MIKAFVLFSLCLHTVAVTAQEVQTMDEPLVHQMVEAWIGQNRSDGGIDGWRVQLMASTDRQQVEAGKTSFLSLYPDIPADWTHEKPYYKLRVGAFRTRQEARAFIVMIQEAFPGSYPAKDSEIPPQDFLNMNF